MRRPFIQDQTAAVVGGLLLFGLGALLLYDAYERRGQKAPRVLRPFTFW